MNTNTKFRILFGITVICLTALVVQTAYLWQLDQKLAGTQIDTETELPPGVEKRLEAALAQSDPVPDPYNPFGGSSLFGSSVGADPFENIRQMQQRMDSLFGGFSMPQFNPGNSFTFTSSSPNLELQETEDEYRVVIQTGEGQDVELSTQLEDSRLTVNGVVKSSLSNNSGGFASNIVSQSQFSRSFDLPGEVEELGIVTEQVDEGLMIRVPKKVS
ncbi:MAG: hypothetical protein DHS20C12_15940 [Pseudohongiella sp.]|nr:MAG: hypothetical protein DHS20C12_15940 [Pseudohongiella sp.]